MLRGSVMEGDVHKTLLLWGLKTETIYFGVLGRWSFHSCMSYQCLFPQWQTFVFLLLRSTRLTNLSQRVIFN